MNKALRRQAKRLGLKVEHRKGELKPWVFTHKGKLAGRVHKDDIPWFLGLVEKKPELLEKLYQQYHPVPQCLEFKSWLSEQKNA